ncbi:SDR family NAD(P)-dependent oxidoreductase [Streptomyces carpinensis]|uniref:SDR family oxidoreductase n=1 Tax=Streptomyces carpinensis TaxID=66369 RepID=A0ABV1W868_9ACTN|nr:SDR family oxidoreductase [Streptomyces carpinensis]
MSGHVLITGAASGIGAAIAADLSARGWQVSATDLRADLLERLRADLHARSGAAPRVRAGDLADPDFAEEVVADAWSARPLDALVNAAGIYPARPLLEMTADAWDRVMAVNVRAPMLTTVALARHATAEDRTAAVVNITSGAALRARPGAAHYCTSKAALTMSTKACALELGTHGIRVNAVSPGFVQVDSTANPVTQEYAAAVSPNPLGRIGLPGDLLGAVRFLLSGDANWITGAVLDVDGGSAAGTTELPLHWAGESAAQNGTTRPQAAG